MLISNELRRRQVYGSAPVYADELGGKIRVNVFNCEVTDEKGEKEFTISKITAGRCRVLLGQSPIIVKYPDKQEVPEDLAYHVGHLAYRKPNGLSEKADPKAFAKARKYEGRMTVTSEDDVIGFLCQSVEPIDLILTFNKELPKGAKVEGIIEFVTD